MKASELKERLKKEGFECILTDTINKIDLYIYYSEKLNVLIIWDECILLENEVNYFSAYSKINLLMKC